jgi:hypothetical protein
VPQLLKQPAYCLHKARNGAVATVNGKNHYHRPTQSPESLTFAPWLRGLAVGTKRTRRNPRPAEPRSGRPTRRLAVAGLEDHTVPSATLLTSTAIVDAHNDGTADYAYGTADTFDHRGDLLARCKPLTPMATGRRISLPPSPSRSTAAAAC